MRRFVLAIGGIAVALGLRVEAVRGDQADNVLRRDRGSVNVTVQSGATMPVIGSLNVGDRATATTAQRSLATLQLLDSSEIRIGDQTSVMVGYLRKAAEDPRSAVVTLNRGAIRFNIVHPAGARSSYRFSTPTTQIAVRGTTGYLVSGPAGDQVYCVTCEADVAVSGRGFGPVSLHTGQTLNVSIREGAVVGTEVVANPSVNNPAIDQFLGGFSPFGVPASLGRDPTGSGSGT